MSTDILKQEEVVSALWQFAENLQTKPHDAKRSEEGKHSTSVHLPSVGIALERIMNLFGYEIVSIQ